MASPIIVEAIPMMGPFAAIAILRLPIKYSLHAPWAKYIFFPRPFAVSFLIPVSPAWAIMLEWKHLSDERR